MLREFKISNTFTNREDFSVYLYLLDINKKEMISPEQEVELAQLIHNGDEKAIVQLVEANLRFVVSVAKGYQYSGIPLADLIEEGNYGLIKAAKMFDETKGFKFISYAVWWIRQCIHQAIATQGKMVRLPNNKSVILNKILDFSAKFFQEEERYPSPEEVSDGLNLSLGQVVDTMAYDGRTFSLSTPLGDDSDSGTLEDVIVADEKGADHTMERESLETDINDVLSTLSPRENKIVKMVFGIGQPKQSITDVAVELHLTRERVRQLQEKSIKKLRTNPMVFTKLQKYLAS